MITDRDLPISMINAIEEFIYKTASLNLVYITNIKNTVFFKELYDIVHSAFFVDVEVL